MPRRKLVSIVVTLVHRRNRVSVVWWLRHCVRGGALGRAAAMIDPPNPPQRSRWRTVG